MAEAALGLGSNLGDRPANLTAALRALDATDGIRLLRCSQVYATAPWGDPDQPDFLNAAALVETSLSPEDLLRACKTIEAALGRTSTRRWGPREIDIDLLYLEGVEMESTSLSLPHKSLFERLFVLVPLHDLVGDAPVAGRDLGVAIAALSGPGGDEPVRLDAEATRRLRDALA
ncbi:MAG: 2-amino-4-hydroxy-6-hydroxymethyldihydropteridine diphosphokinase [Alphaproteobacteria bacterium]|nr:2-amino-4-hydroxy-6-hydroxymethyldihydropteridine diphosphokinase [Alphaproteobacteria bacterium]